MSTDIITIDRSSSDYDLRMAAARRRAEWELGDSSWAGVIVGAFLYPDADADGLKREQDVYEEKP